MKGGGCVSALAAWGGDRYWKALRRCLAAAAPEHGENASATQADEPGEPPGEPPSSPHAVKAWVGHAFLQYSQAVSAALDAQRARLPLTLAPVLPELHARFQAQRVALSVNGAFLAELVEEMNLCPPAEAEGRELELTAPGWDFAYVNGALQQLVREWSDEGAAERQQCMGAVMDAMQRHCPPLPDGVPPPRVLIPGAGLARLAWELTSKGYECLAVERAMTMLIVATYMRDVLLPSGRRVRICPYIHAEFGPNNVANSKHLTREILVPDSVAVEKIRANPSLAGPYRIVGDDFCSMACELDQNSAWDAVLFCFFLDACGDLLLAIETAYAVLRAGGLLISCGPLEYFGGGGEHNVRHMHIGGTSSAEYILKTTCESSAVVVMPFEIQARIRLCGDELMLLIERKGFDVLEFRSQKCEYTQDNLSILHSSFDSILFVARKLQPE